MTFSIVAFDPDAGQIGIGVCSFLYAVATRAIFAEPGVGVVATQMMCEPAFANLGLNALRTGRSPTAIIDEILGADAGRETRQLVIMNASGEVAAHTGKQCVESAGHFSQVGCSCQGAMVWSPCVWEKMHEGFVTAGGDLADRILSALVAGEAAGGDLRGRRAAGMIVVSANLGSSWLGAHPVDIRVDDHAQPLSEMTRLLGVQRMLHAADVAFDAGLNGKMAEALDKLARLEALDPADIDIALRLGILLALSGQTEAAAERLYRVSTRDAGWAEVMRRLPAAGFLPEDPALRKALDRRHQADFGISY